MKSERKLVILGFQAVGKTSITNQYIDSTFDSKYYPTIEQSHETVVEYNGVEYHLTVVDSAGQDEFWPMTTQHITGVDGYIYVYSINSQKSFEVVKIINDKILNLKPTTNEFFPRVLVANKKDLKGDRQISSEEGRQLAQEWGCAYVECSAKDNEKIDEIFLALLKEIKKEGEPNTEDSCLLL